MNITKSTIVCEGFALLMACFKSTVALKGPAAETKQTQSSISDEPFIQYTHLEMLTLTAYQCLNEACFVHVRLVGSFHSRVQRHMNIVFANVNCTDVQLCREKWLNILKILDNWEFKSLDCKKAAVEALSKIQRRLQQSPSFELLQCKSMQNTDLSNSSGKEFMIMNYLYSQLININRCPPQGSPENLKK